MAGSQKKVIIRNFGGELVWGYLPASGFVQAGKVELMEIDGRVISIDLSKIRTIAYVKDFNRDDLTDPERIGRKTFLGRPRMAGLWLRLNFRDDEVLEGVTEFDLAVVEGVSEDGGLTITPPDGRGNALRIFVPKTALQAVEVIGLIQVGVKKDVTVRKPSGTLSGDLFPMTEKQLEDRGKTERSQQGQ